jgi:hypothetical protein
MGQTFDVNPSSFQVDFLRSSSADFYLKLHCNKKIQAFENGSTHLNSRTSQTVGV